MIDKGRCNVSGVETGLVGLAGVDGSVCSAFMLYNVRTMHHAAVMMTLMMLSTSMHVLSRRFAAALCKRLNRALEKLA